MTIKQFVISKVENHEIDKLFLVCDMLNIDIYPSFKKDRIMGEYHAVAYTDRNDIRCIERATYQYLPPVHYHKFKDVDEFCKVMLDS